MFDEDLFDPGHNLFISDSESYESEISCSECEIETFKKIKPKRQLNTHTYYFYIFYF